MHRLAIVGKTTLGQQVAARLDSRHIELDTLYWGPNWRSAPPAVFRERLATELAADRWVTSGNYRLGRDLIWGRADTLIWLDYPLALTFGRLLRRTLSRICSGERLWGGNRETWRNTFFSRDSLLLYALKTHRRHQREFPADLALPEYAHLQVLRFRSPDKTEQWLSSF
jgi:adenylate kinase family enzyme